MTNDSNSSTEINVRLAIARQVMRQLTEIWKSGIGRDQSETKETVSQVVGVEHSVIWI